MWCYKHPGLPFLPRGTQPCLPALLALQLAVITPISGALVRVQVLTFPQCEISLQETPNLGSSPGEAKLPLHSQGWDEGTDPPSLKGAGPCSPIVT